MTNNPYNPFQWAVITTMLHRLAHDRPNDGWLDLDEDDLLTFGLAATLLQVGEWDNICRNRCPGVERCRNGNGTPRLVTAKRVELEVNPEGRPRVVPFWTRCQPARLAAGERPR